MPFLIDALHIGRRNFRGSSTAPRSGHLRPHGRVINDPTVGSSTTPRSGYLSPHGRIIYDLTVVSSTTPRSGYLRPHGRVIYDPTVVYFTATFPYLVLIILFFRGVTLPGALDGIKFYVIPQWSKLLEPKVWGDAAGQIFFSLSVGMGGLMTFASYNKFHNNIYRDTMIVTIGNCVTSLFAGFVIFAILGFMAHERGVDVPEVVKSGAGLAFIAYPEVVTHLPIPQLWSFLFFFMLITLGLDSQFAGLESIMTSIIDTVPRLRRYKTWVALILCIVMYILGLTMCSEAGIYWLELMSYYAAGWSLVLIGLIECVVFSWVYGANRLIDNIEEMVGFRLNAHWWFCWKFITPLLLVVIFVVNVIEFTPLAVGDYVMPPWAQALGWLMAVASVAAIIPYAIYHIWSSYNNPEYDGVTFWRRLAKLSQPTEQWGKRADTLGTFIELHVVQADGIVWAGSPPSYSETVGPGAQNTKL
ncbi:Sodium- and chloride-dependent glycine transporter 1 [Lamellibrachia satsuma]|nr:Sodium- and chloride-dependent glycine transporter 1 [Lamellibrachia satsuma]